MAINLSKEISDLKWMIGFSIRDSKKYLFKNDDESLAKAKINSENMKYCKTELLLIQRIYMRGDSQSEKSVRNIF